MTDIDIFNVMILMSMFPKIFDTYICFKTNGENNIACIHVMAKAQTTKTQHVTKVLETLIKKTTNMFSKIHIEMFHVNNAVTRIVISYKNREFGAMYIVHII